MLLGTFLLCRVVVLGMLISEPDWQVGGWCPSICERQLIPEIFILKEFRIGDVLELGLLLAGRHQVLLGCPLVPLLGFALKAGLVDTIVVLRRDGHHLLKVFVETEGSRKLCKIHVVDIENEAELM